MLLDAFLKPLGCATYVPTTTVYTSVLPPHRGGAVPSPMDMGRNGRRDLPRRSTERLPPLSWTFFSLGRPLTGHNWAAPLLLIDRTPFGVFLSWHCSLLVAMSILTRAPSATILTPGTPAPSVTLMWTETLFSALLASSGCTSFAPPLPVLTFAQSVQLALQWVGVAWRATPKAKLASPFRPIPSLHCLHPLHPLPRVPPTTARLLSITSTSGPPTLPLLHVLLEVGKDSPKCSTCSKWVHFSCSSLTRADFRKICAAGSPMGWNCPACLNGDLASPTHQQASPASSLQLHPHPHPPTNMLRSHGFISTSPLTPSPP